MSHPTSYSKCSTTHTIQIPAAASNVIRFINNQTRFFRINSDRKLPQTTAVLCGLEEIVGGGEEVLRVLLEDKLPKQTFPASNRGIKREFGVF